MYPEGICLSLIKEFDKELNGLPYSILPLNRKSESNTQVNDGLRKNSSAVLASMTMLSKNMLRAKANIPTETQEVITRPGLRVDTVDNAGNHTLCRPINQSRAALNKATNKGVKVCFIQQLNYLNYLCSIIYKGR
jgi:hypothetical protein